MKPINTRCPKCNAQFAKTLGKRTVGFGPYRAVFVYKLCEHCGSHYSHKEPPPETTTQETPGAVASS